jgi:hypothetical protein
MNSKQTVLLAILLSVTVSSLFSADYVPTNYYRKYGLMGFFGGVVLSSGAYCVTDVVCPGATKMIGFTQWILGGTTVLAGLFGIAGMEYGAREDRKDVASKLSTLKEEVKNRTVESFLLIVVTASNNKFTPAQQTAVWLEVQEKLIIQYGRDGFNRLKGAVADHIRRQIPKTQVPGTSLNE